MPTSTPSEHLSLVERLQGADRDAWWRFGELYCPLIYRWVRQWGVSAEDAPAAVECVFLRLLRAINLFAHEGPDASFREWLWTITRSATRDFIRYQGGRPAVDLAEILPQAEPYDTLTNLTHRALRILEEEGEQGVREIVRSLRLGEEPSEAATGDLARGDEPPGTRSQAQQATFQVLCRLRQLVSDR